MVENENENLNEKSHAFRVHASISLSFNLLHIIQIFNYIGHFETDSICGHDMLRFAN